MNRENKRKQYEKGYYKTHGCSDSFTCKVCGRLVVPTGAGSDHRNHCPNCLSSLHLDIELEIGKQTAEGSWTRWAFGSEKMASGRSSTDAGDAGI